MSRICVFPVHEGDISDINGENTLGYDFLRWSTDDEVDRSLQKASDALKQASLRASERLHMDS